MLEKVGALFDLFVPLREVLVLNEIAIEDQRAAILIVFLAKDMDDLIRGIG